MGHGMNAVRLLDRTKGTPEHPGGVDQLLREAGLGGRTPRIRCPRCRWQPRRDSRWVCTCGFGWNTFDTHGECPGCQHQWTVTQCLACERFSPHEDWYETGSDDRSRA